MVSVAVKLLYLVSFSFDLPSIVFLKFQTRFLFQTGNVTRTMLATQSVQQQILHHLRNASYFATNTQQHLPSLVPR